MEDIFVTKIIETESQAEKIVLEATETANNLIENYKLENSLEKKKLEKKYDDMVAEKQDAIKSEFETEFNQSLDEMKTEVDNLKSQSIQNYDDALKILLAWREENGNS